MFGNNFLILLYLAANPLDSFTAEYNSDEEKKKTSNEEGKEAVNENHVEQFMQVSKQVATAVSTSASCRVLQQSLTAFQQHKRTVVK